MLINGVSAAASAGALNQVNPSMLTSGTTHLTASTDALLKNIAINEAIAVA